MVDLTEHGPKPYVLDIEQTTLENPNFRATLWTGKNIQLTVMSIPVGGDIGLEVHQTHDQFLRIEQGKARVEMGPSETVVDFTAEAEADWAVFVPAGTWHNLINIGDVELKLYTVYGPPDHVPGTLHPTQHDAEIDPNEH